MDREREIIVVTTCLTDGGAERVLSELMDSWNKAGNRIALIQLKAGASGDCYFIPDDIERIDLKQVFRSKLMNYISYLIQMIRILSRRKNAVVVAFTYAPIFMSAAASRFTGSRTVFSERNDPDSSPSKKILRILRNWSFRAADACVFQTEDAKSRFPAAVREKGIVIPNPVNPHMPERFQGERRKAVVAACRLEKQKNIPMLIDAFARLHEEHPDYVLEIYGRGTEREALQTYISGLGLQEQVKLMGFAQNVYEKMADCSIYASSSNYEGISNSMLEALALGLPSVCTDCPAGGARLAIRNGENGFLVPVGDVDGMYRAMKKIVEDLALARRLSDNAYKTRETFSIEKIGRQWLDLLWRE